ncbi:hypothetical protein GCM10023156_48830 [Novipirellula rosea]|uniref:Uncharacterized protein n=1 Tax=Novipirellula rosea TaxID=1031540 RepID=A0ABP8NCH6_9BACT
MLLPKVEGIGHSPWHESLDDFRYAKLGQGDKNECFAALDETADKPHPCTPTEHLYHGLNM